MTNFINSGERDESAEASRLIEDLISEVLGQTELELQSVNITVPNHRIHELDIEVIQIGEGVVRIARPSTDEHTHRSLYLIRRQENGLMSALEVEILRDKEREVSPATVEQALKMYDELLDEGEAMGLIDKQQLLDESELAAQHTRLAVDRHALAMQIGENEIADQIQAEIRAMHTSENLAETLNAGDPAVNAWLESLSANIAHRNELADQAMSIEAEYTKAAMAAVVDARPMPLNLALAWQVQRDVDRALNPES